MTPPHLPAGARVPLVVGVVAQPGLAGGGCDTAQLCRAAVAYLGDLYKRLPDTPVLLLTALANEVEVAVVDAALAVARPAAPTELVVVTWPGASNQNEATTARGRVLDLREVGPAAPSPDPARAAQLFIARSCSVLVAAYEEAGAVPEAVLVKRRGLLDPATAITPADDPLETPDTGPVVRLVPTSGVAKEWERIAPEVYDNHPDDRELYFDRHERIAKERLDQFNKDAAERVTKPQVFWGPSRDYLMTDTQAAAINLPSAPDGLRDAFAAANYLANCYQQMLQWRVGLSVIVLVVALLAFSAYSHLAKHGAFKDLALVGYLALLALADYLLLVLFRGPLRQQLYQDYRALAEGLRVQFGWWLGGVRRVAADYYLAHQKNDLDWIRQAIRAVAVRAAARPAGAPPPLAPNVPEALKTWVVGQLAFYRKNSLRERAWYLFYREAASGLLVASLLLSVGVAIAAAVTAFPAWAGWTALAALLIPVAVGARHVWHKYQEADEQHTEEREELMQAEELGNQIDGLGSLAPKDRPDFWLYRWGGFLGALALGLVLTGAIVASFRDWLHPHVKEEAEEWLIVAMVFAAFVAALIQWHLERRAFRLHHRNYRRMRVVFARAYRMIERVWRTDPAAATRVLERLGEEALAEHAEWLRLHRDRPLELPRLEL